MTHMTHESVSDASEMTEDEVELFGEWLQVSLKEDYLEEMKRLYLLGKYSTDVEGWQQLVNEAWATAVANNALCQAVNAKCAERRNYRLSQTESPATAGNPGIERKAGQAGGEVSGLCMLPPALVGMLH